MLWNSLPAQGFQLRFAEFSPKVPKFVSKQKLFGYFLEANVPLASVLPELSQRLALNQSDSFHADCRRVNNNKTGRFCDRKKFF